MNEVPGGGVPDSEYVTALGVVKPMGCIGAELSALPTMPDTVCWFGTSERGVIGAGFGEITTVRAAVYCKEPALAVTT